MIFASFSLYCLWKTCTFVQEFRGVPYVVIPRPASLQALAGFEQ